jgi:hypothetical protein
MNDATLEVYINIKDRLKARWVADNSKWYSKESIVYLELFEELQYLVTCAEIIVDTRYRTVKMATT